MKEIDSKEMQLSVSEKKIGIVSDSETITKTCTEMSDGKCQSKDEGREEDIVDGRHKCQFCNLSFFDRQILDDHVEHCDPYAECFATADSNSKAGESRKHKAAGTRSSKGQRSNMGKVPFQIDKVDTPDDLGSKGMAVVSLSNIIDPNSRKNILNMIKKKTAEKTNASCSESNNLDSKESQTAIGTYSGNNFDRSKSGRKRKAKNFDDYETDYPGTQKSIKRTSDCSDPDIVTKTEVQDTDVEMELNKDADSKKEKNRNTGVTFLCPLCSEADEALEKIQEHIRTKHEQEKLSWVVLSEKYSKMLGVDKDPASRVKEGQSVCLFCKEDWHTTEELKLHVNRQHAYFPFCCGICRLAYSTKEAVKFHMKKYHVKTQHVCVYCQENFRTIRDLKKHSMEFHSKQKQVRYEKRSENTEKAKSKQSRSGTKERNMRSASETEGLGVKPKEEVPDRAESVEDKPNKNEIDNNLDQVNLSQGKDTLNVGLASSLIYIKSARIIPKVNRNKREKTIKKVTDSGALPEQKEEIDGKDDDLNAEIECDDPDRSFKDTVEDFVYKPKILFMGNEFSSKQPRCKHLFDFSSLKKVGFKCGFQNCEQVLKTFFNWQRHLTTHIPGRERQPLKCMECSYMTRDKTFLSQHLLMKHSMLDRVEIGMEHCQVVDSKTSTPVKVIACVFCGFLNDIEHFSTQHKCDRKKVHFYCPFCDKKDPVFEKLQEHIKEKHSDMTIYRQELGNRYQTLRTAQRDPAYSINSTDTVCGECKQEFGTNDELKLHVNEKHAIGPYSCGVCRQCYVRHTGVADHMRKTHSLPQVCPYCSRRFGDKTDLARHETTHLNTKPFKCDLCPSRYSDKKALNSHYRVKHSIKPEDLLSNRRTIKSEDTEPDPEILPCDNSDVNPKSLSEDERHAKLKESNDKDNFSEIYCADCSTKFTSEKLHKQHLCTGKVEGSIPNKTEVYDDADQTVKDMFDMIQLNPTPGTQAKIRCGLCNKDFNEIKDMFSHIRQFHVPNDGGTELHDSDDDFIDTEDDTNDDETFMIEKKPKRKHKGKKNLRAKQQNYQSLFDFSGLKEVGFRCSFEYCGEIFPTMVDWRSHLSKHLKRKAKQVLQCIDCGYSTRTKALLSQHLLSKHSMLDSVEIGMEHCQVVDSKAYTPVKVIACVFCGFLMDLDNFSAQHQCVRKKVYFYCPFCDKKDPIFEKLQEHIKEKHSDMTIYRQKLGNKYQTLRTAQRDPAYSINSTDTVCERCKQEFETNDDLKLHVNEIHAFGPYSCGVCRQCYGRLTGVMEHMKKTHKLLMACQHCNRGFGDKADLARHEATHLKTKPFKCDLCPCSYSDQKGLTFHSRLKHQRKSKKLQSYGTTVNDMDMESEPDIIICDFCGLSLQTLSQYQKHVKTHKMNDKDNLPHIKCDICSKGFTSRKAYTRHLCTSRISGSDPVIIEGYSDSVQSVKDIFLKIKQNPTPGTKAIVRCGLCRKEFNKNKYMYNHIRQIHLPNEGKKVRCDICGLGFARKVQLQLHMRSHSNVKPYRCRICGKSYRQLGHIRVHLLSHSSKPIFKCKLCTQVFKSKCTLGNHVISHCDILPYKCFVKSCEKSFVSLPNLLVHVRLCDSDPCSDTRYECKLCSHKIKDLISGLSHMKSHGKDALHRCSLCSQEFITYKKLYDHKAELNHFSQSEMENGANRIVHTQNFKSVEVSEDVDMKVLQQQYDYFPDDSDTKELNNHFEQEADLREQTDHGIVEETDVDNIIDSDELMDIAQQLTHMASGDVLNMEIKDYVNDQKCIVEQVETDVKAYSSNLFENPVVEMSVPRTIENSQNRPLACELTVIDESDLFTEDLLGSQKKRLVKYKNIENSETSKVKLNHRENMKTSVQNSSLWLNEEGRFSVKVLGSHPIIDESAVLVSKETRPKIEIDDCVNETVESNDDKGNKMYENQLKTDIISEKTLASSKILDESGREVKVNVINEEGQEIPIQSNPELLQALLTTGSYSLEYNQQEYSTNECSKDDLCVEGSAKAVSETEVLKTAANKFELQEIEFDPPNNSDIENASNIYVVNEVQSDAEFVYSSAENKIYKSVQKKKKLKQTVPQSKRQLMNVDKVCGEITDKEAQVGNNKMENGEVNYKVRLGYYEDRSKQKELYPLKCDLCQRRFKRYKDLNFHKKIHLPNDEKPFQCKQCGKGFTSRHNYMAHEFTHTGDRPHKCNQCDKSFRQLGHLQTHLRTHANYRPFKCTHCEKIFVTNSQLKAHVQTHGTYMKPGVAKGVNCSVCGLCFANEKNVNIHMIKHMCTEDQNELVKTYNAVKDDKPKGKPEKPMQKECMCDVCGKMFSRSSDLKEHKELHFPGQKVMCKECGKEFISERRLQAHIRLLHSAESWQCDTCGKQLKSKSSFYSHLRLHKDPKFQCTLCKKTFLRKYVFLQHMTICIGEEIAQKVQ